MGIKFVTEMLGICDNLVEEAEGLVELCDPEAIVAFAEKLGGLEGLDLHSLREKLTGVEMPGDFRHFRLYNLTTGLSAGGRYCTKQSALTLDDILIHLSIIIDMDHMTPHGRGVWTKTVAFPVNRPGLLELGLEFLPRN